MRRIFWGSLAYASVIWAGLTAGAQAQWYVEGSVGTQLRMDDSRTTTFLNGNGISGPGSNTATFDTGFVANLGLGYKLPLGFRVEGELGYAHYSLSSVSPLSTNGAFPQLNGSRFVLQSGGGYDEGTATANAFYDLPISGRIVPYIGGGLGAALISQQAASFLSPDGLARFNVSGGSIVYPVILGEVGLNIAFNANWAVVPSYRFEHVFTTGGSTDNSNIFKLGVRYSW